MADSPAFRPHSLGIHPTTSDLDRDPVQGMPDDEYEALAGACRMALVQEISRQIAEDAAALAREARAGGMARGSQRRLTAKGRRLERDVDRLQRVIAKGGRQRLCDLIAAQKGVPQPRFTLRPDPKTGGMWQVMYPPGTPCPPRSFAIPGHEILAAFITTADERYILDAEVTRTAVTLILDQKEALERACKGVSMPAPSFWMESPTPPKEEIAVERGLMSADDPTMYSPLRRGAIVQCSDDSLRRGVMRTAWISQPGFVQIGPLQATFDLDDPNHHTTSMVKVDTTTKVLRHLSINGGNDYLTALFAAGYRKDEVLAHLSDFHEQMITDWMFVYAVSNLLFTRNALAEKKVKEEDLSGINRARKKKGKPPYSPRTELSMKLTGGSGSAGRKEPAKHGDGENRAARSSPAWHWVNGHFFVRKGVPRWRKGHYRGDASKLLTGAPRITKVTL